jgi:hypothetical protein
MKPPKRPLTVSPSPSIGVTMIPSNWGIPGFFTLFG